MVYHKLRALKRTFSPQRVVGVIVVIAIAGLGVYLLGSGRAQSPYFNNEAEVGSPASGASLQSDNTASNGTTIKFGGACSGVQIAAGADIQTALNANPSGTTFCLAATTYRITIPLAPKANQQLIGVTGQTDLNGSKVVTGFTSSGSSFVATGFLPSTPLNPNGQCAPVGNGCNFNEWVFRDNQPLTRVLSLSALATGDFYEDYPANKIYLADNPSGHTVEQAVAPEIINSGAAGVVIKNLTIEKAATAAQVGAIAGGNNGATSWDVENNDIRLNHGAGVMVDSGIMKGNHVHQNGQLGVSGHLTGGTLANNEIDHNNWAGFDPGWESGGAKLTGAINWDIASNNVHDNVGPGLWCDINCVGVTFENNTLANNITGILYEISYNGIIRNNTATNNGGATTNGFYSAGTNILVSASPNTEVSGNTVSGGNGIGLLQQNRSGDPATNGPHEDHDDFVHDNTITVNITPSYAAGLSEDVGDQTYFTQRNNRFVHNTYHLPNQTAGWFTWMDANRTKTEWVNFGEDTTGTFLSP